MSLELPLASWSVSRRRFLSGLGVGAASTLLWTPGVFAEELSQTPSQTEGPFYPDKLPLDTDNDLLVINDTITPAVGTIAHFSGQVLDINGKPLKNAVIEIWQCDNNGSYIHSKSGNREKLDGNFQGFGRFVTGSTGEYYFRTIRPVAYPGRTPHIHVKVKRDGKELLTTQCYIKGEPANEKDGVLRGLRDEQAKAALMADFRPLKESKIGEQAAEFRIIVGLTPADPKA